MDLLTLIGNCLLIIVARIADVTLGTLRTASIVQGRRRLAFLLGFFEVLIWVSVVLKIISHLNMPAHVISYALGFALGNYLGISIEDWIGFGEQLVRIISPRENLASELWKAGYRATVFMGTGRDGPVYLVFVKIDRKKTKALLQKVNEIAPKAFYAIGDVRESSTSDLPVHYPTGWRAIIKKK